MPCPPRPHLQLIQHTRATHTPHTHARRLAPGSILSRSHDLLTALGIVLKKRWTRIIYCKVRPSDARHMYTRWDRLGADAFWSVGFVDSAHAHT